MLVHDGGRPAVSSALVGAVARAAAEHGAAIPVVPIVETVKRIDDGWIARVETALIKAENLAKQLTALQCICPSKEVNC